MAPVVRLSGRIVCTGRFDGLAAGFLAGLPLGRNPPGLELVLELPGAERTAHADLRRRRTPVGGLMLMSRVAPGGLKDVVQRGFTWGREGPGEVPE